MLLQIDEVSHFSTTNLFRVFDALYIITINNTEKAFCCNSLRSFECAISPKAKQENTAQSVPFLPTLKGLRRKWYNRYYWV